MLPFGSYRTISLCCHFILTTFLVWTRYPSIQISLRSDHSSVDYRKTEDSYLALIAWGIILLIMEFLMLPITYDKLYFRNVINFGLDWAACFFIAWIVLDGLSWRTYIYIFVFCV
ncbi:hypothetical protein EON65_16730 [archaeon]|nr:MAG: hypothetical protein EON65_16730 [archaeon]